MGILAAIAIPNFVRFQAKSKQSECKMNLKAAWIAQQSFRGETDKWGTSAQEIGFSPERTRYTYRIGPRGGIPAAISQTPDAELEAGYSARLLEEIRAEGEALTMACAGNIDGDPTIDVWSISSEQRVIDGEVVPPGTPFNEQDDVRD